MKNKITRLVKICIFSAALIAIVLIIIGKKEKSISEELIPKSIVAEDIDIADTIVGKMGVGWNLGNTLDAYSTNQIDHEAIQQYKSDYQIMATYSTKNYSGWDASEVPYFNSTNSDVELNWRISTLNSATEQACGSFRFQIINHNIEDTGLDTLDYTVTKAQFTTAEGITIILEDILGEYSKIIEEDVTDYVIADLSRISQLETTADVLGGELTIIVRINDYPLPKTVSTISKENYYETLWGNPITTKEMIDQVKEAGFGAVRIPVTYYNHIDEQGNIDEAWLARVREVVNYVLDNNMYCVINMHHDTGVEGWMKADINTIDLTGDRFANIWEQIAEYFKDYDQKLLFEGYNELLNIENKWSWAGEEAYMAANQLNQIFVDTVRRTGGNNNERCLIVNTYAASVEEEVIKSFKLPTDTVENRLIVEAHYYGSTKTSINHIIERLNTHFVSKGTPVIIGECGTPFSMNGMDRVEYATNLITAAKQYNITCFWWDDGNYANEAGAQSNYSIFDKVTLTWYHPSIVNALIEARQSIE